MSGTNPTLPIIPSGQKLWHIPHFMHFSAVTRGMNAFQSPVFICTVVPALACGMSNLPHLLHQIVRFLNARKICVNNFLRKLACEFFNQCLLHRFKLDYLACFYKCTKDYSV